MKKDNCSVKSAVQKILLGVVVFSFWSCHLLAQKAFRDYEDGKIWFKLKEGAASMAAEPPGQENFNVDHLPFVGKLKAKYKLQKLAKPFAKFKKIQNISPLRSTYLLSFDDIRNVDKLIKELVDGGMVEYAEKVPINRACFSPNDPALANQWHLAKINASTAWNYFSAGSNVVIAIIDNAVDRNHPDITPNLWVNPDEIPWNRIDDDRNGYVDDINGWDFASNDDNPNPEGPAWMHGTHVAGIASAATNNGIGIASIGFSSKIMCIKASTWDDPTWITNGYDGILYAAQNGAHIINLSWGILGVSSITIPKAVCNPAYRMVFGCWQFAILEAVLTAIYLAS